MVDRLRKVSLRHLASAAEKFIAFDGHTLTYGLHLHNQYDGRYPLQHLQEILEEGLPELSPQAPPVTQVQTIRTQLSTEIVPAILQRLQTGLGLPVALHFSVDQLGNHLFRARNCAPWLQELQTMLLDLLEDEDAGASLRERLCSIELKLVCEESAQALELKGDRLLICTCLDAPDGRGALSNTEIDNALRRALRRHLP
jgi:hypothetical protein